MNRLKTLVVAIIFILVLPVISFADSIDDPNSDWFAGELTNVDIESAEIPRNFSFNDGNGQEFKYSINKINTATYKNYMDFDYIIKVFVSKINTPEMIWWDVDDLIKGFDDELSWYLADQPKISLITRGAATLLEDKEVATLKNELPVQLNVSRRVYGLTRYFSNHTDNSNENPYDYYAGDYFTEQMVHEKLCYKLENISSRMSVEQGYGFKIPYFKWEDVKIIDKSSWDYSFPTEYNFGGIIYFEYVEDNIQAAIETLPAADAITLEDKEAIEAARTQYDDLSDESKAEITNYAKLQLAEATIAKLEAEQELAATKTQLSAVSAQLESALSDNVTAQDTIKDLKAKVEKAEADLKTAQDNLEAANKAIEEAKAASGTKEKEMQEQIDKANSDLQTAQSSLDDANAALAEAQETIKVQKKAVKGVKAKGQKKKAKVTWKSAGKGFKYEVYSSTKISSKFKKAATVKKTEAVVKKLKSKKTYYIKVRAFKTINGKKVYTQYSDTVSVKAK